MPAIRGDVSLNVLPANVVRALRRRPLTTVRRGFPSPPSAPAPGSSRPCGVLTKYQASFGTLTTSPEVDLRRRWVGPKVESPQADEKSLHLAGVFVESAPPDGGATSVLGPVFAMTGSPCRCRRPRVGGALCQVTGSPLHRNGDPLAMYQIGASHDRKPTGRPTVRGQRDRAAAPGVRLNPPSNPGRILRSNQSRGGRSIERQRTPPRQASCAAAVLKVEAGLSLVACGVTVAGLGSA